MKTKFMATFLSLAVSLLAGCGSNNSSDSKASASAKNIPPFFISPAPDVAQIDVAYTYNFRAVDADAKPDPTVVSANLSDTCGGVITDNGDGSGAYVFTPDASQVDTQCVVGLTASDGEDETEQNSTVNIGDENAAPYFTSVAPTTATEDALYTYDITVDDDNVPAQTLTIAEGIFDTCGGTVADNGDGTATYSFTPDEYQGGAHCVVGATVTDSLGASIDQYSVVTVTETNNAPTFTSSAPTMIDENELYIYSATVTDSDFPPQTLDCEINAFDTCGGSLSGCAYIFEPTEAEGGASCVVGLTVNDDGSPSLSADQNTVVNIEEVNSSPSFASTAPTEASEGSLYTYRAIVSDPDTPAQTLTCSKNTSDTCGGALAGCLYTFTPTESQGGTNCVIGLTVTDDGAPVLSAEQNITVYISETNSAPTFTSTAPTTAAEGIPYSYSATASDSDVPAQALTITRGVFDTCEGVVLDNGDGTATYSFTPDEYQGGDQCLEMLTVADGAGAIADQYTLIDVAEINSQPVFNSSAPATVSEGELYFYSANVSDTDFPMQNLNCAINVSDTCAGELTGCVYMFTPAETQGGTSCVVGLIVADNGSPVLTAIQNTKVTISEINSSPSFVSTAPTGATEGVQYTYSADVSDSDSPAQALTCSKNTSDTCGGTLTGCSYEFTPTESQGGTNCVVGLTVTDNGSPVLSATQNTTIYIGEVNSQPTITSSAPTTASEGVQYTYNATVSDSDLPAQTLTCSVNPSDSCGGSLSGYVYTFTPTETQGGGNCVVGLRVSDNGIPILSSDQNITVSVAKTNSAPIFTSTAPTTASEGVLYSYSATVSDSDTPAQTLVCSKNVSDTCGGTLTGCAYSFTPTESQGGAGCVMGLTVTDNGSPALFTNQNTTVSVSEVNSTPTWTTAPTDITIAMGNSYNQTNGQASDSDLPAQTLTCSNAGSDCSFTATVSGSGSGSANCNVSIPTITSSETCDLNIGVSDGAGGTITDTITITAGGCVIFVNDNASGSNNGSSWTNAYTNIQTAMNAASAGCQLWVAEGTYANSPVATTSVLTMKASVQAYGGFAGTETSLAQRTHPAGRPSVLDGGSTSYHVVTMASNTRLDGFTVIYGKAAGTWNVTGSGGGVYSQSVSNVYVTNCIIRNNSAQWYGGGIELTGVSSVTIENNLIYSNSAQQGGGLDTDSVINVRNCTIAINTVSDQGGGIDVYATNPIITNCIVWGNTASVGYPGIYPQPNGATPAAPVVTYSDVQNGFTGAGNINSDPLFAAGTYGSYYLTQATSPCVNTGSATAASLGFGSLTTSPANAVDSGVVDMGFHYPIP